jgi:hypothetical protein
MCLPDVLLRKMGIDDVRNILANLSIPYGNSALLLKPFVKGCTGPGGKEEQPGIFNVKFLDNPGKLLDVVFVMAVETQDIGADHTDAVLVNDPDRLLVVDPVCEALVNLLS